MSKEISLWLFLLGFLFFSFALGSWLVAMVLTPRDKIMLNTLGFLHVGLGYYSLHKAGFCLYESDA